MPDVAQNGQAKLASFITPAPVAAQTFEIGLVLGGTVSAGAYTAGALDLLIQALDKVYAPPGPPHQIKLRLAAGSSGGAVCAAILGVSLNRTFPPADASEASLSATQGPVDNQFWDLWVNQLQFLPMLNQADLAALITPPDPAEPPGGAPPPQHAASLLNASVIDAAVTQIVTYAGAGGDTSRAWAASPFRIATTVCNLRGIPFKVAGAPPIGAFAGSAYVEHDDYAWFALPNVVGLGDGAAADARPNEFWLSTTPVAGLTVGYQTLGDFARASAAMPIGLPARPLSRPAAHYVYRPYARVDDDGQVRIAWPSPDWSELPGVTPDGTYDFTGVDGGTLNNDPVKIAHEALSGIGATNDRTPQGANRALFLIDPLADQPPPIGRVGLSLVAATKAVIGTFIGGARYLTADLDLFQSEDVFSRFQLVPSRPGPDGTNLLGEAALAGTDLLALGGWCARPFRVHDFLLGRFNMAGYLRREFNLRADNTLFDNWTAGMRADYALLPTGDRFPDPVDGDTPRATYFLPVIPMPPEDFGVALPAWPKDAFDPASIKPAIETRVEKLLDTLRQDNVPGAAGWLIGLILFGGVADTIAGDVVKAFRQSLMDRGLLTPDAAPGV